MNCVITTAGRYTPNEEVQPCWFIVWFYYLINMVFGFTFGIKLMEMGEEGAQKNYSAIANEIPKATKIEDEENEIEQN